MYYIKHSITSNETYFIQNETLQISQFNTSKQRFID